MDENKFLDQFIEVEIEAEKLLLGRHEVNGLDVVQSAIIIFIFDVLVFVTAAC